jgi:hypothetical protein
MIRVAGTAGSQRAGSVRRVLLTSCAVVAAAGIMLLAAPITGSSPARAQFGGFGGFHITIGPGHWRRGSRRSYRSSRRHKRHKGDDDAPDPDTGGGSSATPASTPAPDSGRPAVRPASSTQPEPRASAGRPAPRGPDLEPSK